jgi:SAM-dependent methyltransferase
MTAALALVEQVWRRVRRGVPLKLYPILAPVHRLRRKHQIKSLAEDDERLRRTEPDLVAPPAELRYNVAGPCTIPQFLAAGDQTVTDIDRALHAIGRSLAGVTRLLDFGCGCGRLLLSLERQVPARVALSGCDVDARAVQWCQDHLRRARCVTNDPLPSAPFESGTFDLIWCGSVFTHLDEERQDQWLHELHRLLAPGGILLASVHGEACWASRLSAHRRAILQRDGMTFARFGLDAGVHPDWYQIAWHTEDYVRAHWGAIFRIVRYLPRGLHAYQDIVVAQRPM